MRSAKRQAKCAKSPELEMEASEEVYDSISGTFLLKYQINDEGIGHICLPPGLSMLLQSGQIYIMPSAGGLFFRSIDNENALDLQSAKLPAQAMFRQHC